MHKHDIETWTKIVKKSLWKGFHNLVKLRNAVAIYKINKLVSSKKSLKCHHMSLKPRDLEEVSYSKSSCSILIKYSLCLLSLSAMIKHRAKNSHNITVLSCCRTHLNQFLTHHSFISCCLWKTNQLLCAWPTFIFIGQFSKQNNFWRNLTLSQYYDLLSKWVPNREKLLL